MAPGDSTQGPTIIEPADDQAVDNVSQARIWVGKVFVIAALVEAVTWTGLLIGMYVKYSLRTTDLGVQIFGNLHGFAFLAYVAITIASAIMLRWRWGTATLALLASIPPLMTIPLELWIRRTGRLNPQALINSHDTAGMTG